MNLGLLVDGLEYTDVMDAEEKLCTPTTSLFLRKITTSTRPPKEKSDGV
jgi:hypothetical protein